MNAPRLTLGVLGGMGPAASSLFLRWIIECARDVHGARRNEDFPHVLLSSLPVRDVIEGEEGIEAVLSRVEHEAAVLARAGADLLLLTCNTLHPFLPRFSARAGRPFLSMVDVTASVLQRDTRQRVGLLATTVTVGRGLYQARLGSDGTRVLTPDAHEQASLARVLLRGVGGAFDDSDEALVSEIAKNLVRRGADALVLGCTELSLLETAGGKLEDVAPTYDPLELLADAACATVYAGSVVESQR